MAFAVGKRTLVSANPLPSLPLSPDNREFLRKSENKSFLGPGVERGRKKFRDFSTIGKGKQR